MQFTRNTQIQADTSINRVQCRKQYNETKSYERRAFYDSFVSYLQGPQQQRVNCEPKIKALFRSKGALTLRIEKQPHSTW